MNPYALHQSVLDTTTVTAATTAKVHTLTWPPKAHPNTLHNVPDIIFRVILITLFATVAIWANHEASKGFAIEIVNEAGKYSSPGKRFSLFYESNDQATRILLNTSGFVENLLYPNDQDQLMHTKKQINSVTLALARVNFSTLVSVYSPKPHEYTIMLSPSLMETSHNNEAFVLAVLQGMARVWLWDGKGAAPQAVLNGLVEYITTLAGFRVSDTEAWNSGDDEFCWKNEDPRKVAGFLRYHDRRQQLGDGGGHGGDNGGGEVVRRLNKGMRNGWHDWMMDDALGMAGHHACASYGILTRHHHPSSSI
ncbi:hypothetical protein Hdeb2414_s0007g00239961 [Helianthus debilis subsp. tardiflorus]